MKMDTDPPLEHIYKSLSAKDESKGRKHEVAPAIDLPLIDLGRLLEGELAERERCKRDIANASKEWGFFEVYNHGISKEFLDSSLREEKRLFRRPFEEKRKECVSGFSPDSYRWGAPNATSLQQLSWSEAYHIPLVPAADGMAQHGEVEGTHSLRNAVADLSSAFFGLAHRLVEILVEKLGHQTDYFVESCPANTCYLRFNRYPPCPHSPDVFGFVPHTDSDFLTILYQDQVGGLQLLKDERWVAVKPNPEALVVNIGDLFQAWSNGVYKSLEHRVMAHSEVERFSVAYFMCPAYESVIPSYRQPSMYKEFTFREFRKQVQEDVKAMGSKIGLLRFLNQYPSRMSTTEKLGQKYRLT